MPRNFVSAPLSNLRHEISLRSPIAIPEWVKYVYFSKVMPSAVGKFTAFFPCEPVFLFEVLEKFGSSRVYRHGRREPCMSFGDIYGPYFSCPRINILKQVPVYGF